MIRRIMFWILFGLGKRAFSFGSVTSAQLNWLYRKRGLISKIDGDRKIVTIKRG